MWVHHPLTTYFISCFRDCQKFRQQTIEVVVNVAVNGENNDQRATCYSPCTVFWTESSTVSHFAYRIICDSIPFDLSKKSKPFSFVYIFRLRPTLRVSLDGGTINFSRSWEDVRTVSIVISLYGAETTYNIKLYSFLLAVDGCGGKHGCVYTVYNYFLTLLLFDWRCREVSLSSSSSPAFIDKMGVEAIP